MFGDFLLLTPMCKASTELFKHGLYSLSLDFFDFLKKKKDKTFPVGLSGLLQSVLDENDMSSTKRGKKLNLCFLKER